MSCEALEILVGDVLECVPVCRPDVIEIVGTGPAGPRGADGSAASFVLTEVPTGLINSSNVVYTTAVDFSIIWVFLNGLRMNPGTDYIVTDTNEITFIYPPTTGDTLIVDYIIA